MVPGHLTKQTYVYHKDQTVSWTFKNYMKFRHSKASLQSVRETAEAKQVKRKKASVDFIASKLESKKRRVLKSIRPWHYYDSQPITVGSKFGGKVNMN